MLLQASGRSIGYRGKVSVDILLHTKVLELLDLHNLPYNFKLEELQHTEQTLNELSVSYEVKKQEMRDYYHTETKVSRENNIKLSIDKHLQLTNLHTDILTSKQVKQVCGSGVTLGKVADYFKTKTSIKDGRIIVRGVTIKK